MGQGWLGDVFKDLGPLPGCRCELLCSFAECLKLLIRTGTTVSQSSYNVVATVVPQSNGSFQKLGTLPSSPK